jgi:hypothetical protein
MNEEAAWKDITLGEVVEVLGDRPILLKGPVDEALAHLAYIVRRQVRELLKDA